MTTFALGWPERMSRAPTVSEIVDLRSVNVKPVIHPPKGDGIRPDFDTDVLWKPPLAGRRISRGASLDSQDSEMGDHRRVSISETGISATQAQPISNQPVDFEPGRARRMSFTEMLFGSPGNRRFSWGQQQAMTVETGEPTKRVSVTEDERFKAIMRHQNKVLNDEGGLL